MAPKLPRSSTCYSDDRLRHLLGRGIHAVERLAGHDAVWVKVALDTDAFWAKVVQTVHRLDAIWIEIVHPLPMLVTPTLSGSRSSKRCTGWSAPVVRVKVVHPLSTRAGNPDAARVEVVHLLPVINDPNAV